MINLVKPSFFFPYIPFFCLLGLASVNYNSRGPVFFFIACLYGIVLMLGKKNICITTGKETKWPFVCLMFFSVISAALNYDVKEIIKPLNLGLAYILGYGLYEKCSDKKTFLVLMSFFISAGFFVYCVILYYTNAILLGHDNGSRHLIDFWTGELRNGTLVGLLCSFLIGFSFYCILCQKNRFLNLYGLLSIIITVVINNLTATRTPFVLFVIVYFILLYSKIKSNRKIVAFLGIGLFAFFIVYSTNMFGLISIIQDSSLIERVNEEGFQTSRVDIFLYYLSILFDYPFGGQHGVSVIGFTPHNFIQEMQFEFGIIPFFFACFIALYIIKQLINYYRIEEKQPTDFLIYGILLALFIQCLLEPVYIGYPQILWLLFLYSGIAQFNLNIRQAQISIDVQHGT